MAAAKDQPMSVAAAINNMVRSVNTTNKTLVSTNNDLIRAMSDLKTSMQRSLTSMSAALQPDTRKKAVERTSDTTLVLIKSAIDTNNRYLAQGVMGLNRITSIDAVDADKKWKKQVIDLLTAIAEEGGRGGGSPFRFPGLPGFGGNNKGKGKGGKGRGKTGNNDEDEDEDEGKATQAEEETKPRPRVRPQLPKPQNKPVPEEEKPGYGPRVKPASIRGLTRLGGGLFGGWAEDQALNNIKQGKGNSVLNIAQATLGGATKDAAIGAALGTPLDPFTFGLASGAGALGGSVIGGVSGFNQATGVNPDAPIPGTIQSYDNTVVQHRGNNAKQRYIEQRAENNYQRSLKPKTSIFQPFISGWNDFSTGWNNLENKVDGGTSLATQTVNGIKGVWNNAWNNAKQEAANPDPTSITGLLSTISGTLTSTFTLLSKAFTPGPNGTQSPYGFNNTAFYGSDNTQQPQIIQTAYMPSGGFSGLPNVSDNGGGGGVPSGGSSVTGFTLFGNGPTPTGKSAPRGIRNNNPLNLSYLPGQGASGSDGRFGVYATMSQGIAADARQLLKYASRGTDTIAGIVSKWAPSSENDTTSYINNVSKMMGIPPNQPLNLSDPATMQQLIGAMAKIETGTVLNKNDIIAGVQMAEGLNKGPAFKAPTPTYTGGASFIDARFQEPARQQLLGGGNQPVVIQTSAEGNNAGRLPTIDEPQPYITAQGLIATNHVTSVSI
jgi:hypothetical protein